MKTILRALVIALMVAGLVWSVICIVNDARTHQGAFMTTAQYREIVQEVHK